jgi:hypothetical protein
MKTKYRNGSLHCVITDLQNLIGTGTTQWYSAGLRARRSVVRVP